MTDFSNKIIITDLDETFFGDHASIVDRNIEAIERFTAGGGFFTISTGRIHTSLPKAIPMIKTLVNAPISCCNGALLYDIRTGETVGERTLDHKLTMDMIQYLLARYDEVYIRVSVPEGFLIAPEILEKSPQLRSDVTGNRGTFVLKDYSEWDNFTWYKVVFRGASEKLDAMRADLVEHGFGGVEFTKSGPTFFEIQSEGTNKASTIPAIHDYCARISGKPMKVFCCGDYENDLPMIKAADYGVCPANALDLVKREAKFVLCDHSEGLIADVIEKIEKEGL